MATRSSRRVKRKKFNVLSCVRKMSENNNRHMIEKNLLGNINKKQKQSDLK